MLELFTKKRMIVWVVLLAITTILILIWEEILTKGLGLGLEPNNSATPLHKSTSELTKSEAFISSSISRKQFSSFNQSFALLNGNTLCWLTEDFTVINACHYCTGFEVTSGASDACLKTRYKETILCNISGVVDRGCTKISGVDQAQFWVFEMLLLLSCIVFSGITRLRWTYLERKTIMNYC